MTRLQLCNTYFSHKKPVHAALCLKSQEVFACCSVLFCLGAFSKEEAPLHQHFLHTVFKAMNAPIDQLIALSGTRAVMPAIIVPEP